MLGRKVAVIGGTGGIGRALARVLAAQGASVLVVGQTFRDAGVAGITFRQADLSLMSEARRIGAQLPAEELDEVIFTTGIFAAPQRQQSTEGLERDMAVSFLSRMVIFDAIAGRLGQNRPTAASGRPRVFIMGYPGTGQIGTLGDLNAEQSYSAMRVHMNTVAGNEMLVLEAANRYPHLSVFGLNPGLIRTDIRRNFLGSTRWLFALVEGLIGLLTPTPETYARRIMPLLLHPDLDRHSGAFFDAKAQAILPSPGLTPSHIEVFLAESRALVARTTTTHP